MKKEVQYIIDEKNNLLIRRFIGDMGTEDIIFSWEEILGLKITSKIPSGLVTDLRNANVKIKIEELNKITDYLSKNINIIKTIKLAILADNPQQCVLSMLAKNMFTENKPYVYVKIFSTEEAALNWMQSFHHS